jgi:hypothetical protein
MKRNGREGYPRVGSTWCEPGWKERVEAQMRAEGRGDVRGAVGGFERGCVLLWTWYNGYTRDTSKEKVAKKT